MEVQTSNDFNVAKKIFELGLKPQVGFAQHEGYVLAYLDFLLGALRPWVGGGALGLQPFHTKVVLTSSQSVPNPTGIPALAD